MASPSRPPPVAGDAEGGTVRSPCRDADGVDGEQACKSPSMGGDVYSFKQLKEQKLASPLQAPAAGKHKAPSMIDLLGKGGILDIKKLGKELQDSKWQGSNQSIMSHLREHYIWEELEVIRNRPEEYEGIYVLPSFSSIWEWHGAISIRAGLYQHAIYKFHIRVPSKYPMAEPKVLFSAQCIPFHPFVDPRTGLVNFRYLLAADNNPSGDWNPKLHRVYQLVRCLKALFNPNIYHPHLKDLPGDQGVAAFQLYNPNFNPGKGSGPDPSVLLKSILNEHAVKVLTKNLSWWKKNGSRVSSLEKHLGIQLGKETSSFELQQVSSSSSPSRSRSSSSTTSPSRQSLAALIAEAEKVSEEMQDRSLDYRLLVLNSVVDSQDKLKFNEKDFCIRVRSDIDDLEQVLTPLSTPTKQRRQREGERGAAGGGGGGAEDMEAPEGSGFSDGAPSRMRSLTQALLLAAGLDPHQDFSDDGTCTSPAKGIPGL